ncbi:hypothetical protein KSD_69960 [Ktedonobacter sp. SOSP1-85]|uniref:hypothetical protein n=1 Tax=Ktedonobacter sp. SOSP1-85 TaxID=2778367 RepID=UPI001914E8B0|nr:hypothetical protein [Ktedonobacter sp. SOSP1-85]GHO79225.1 hypothetical protein KSD_69960 [Ktedonobacter sp. SOSP1-85]
MSFSPRLIVIQSICTNWTKASRGGTNASARSHTPQALELPAFPSPVFKEEVFLHEVVYGEHNHFQHPREKWEQLEFAHPFRLDCLALTLQENLLQMTVEWERAEGVPRRFALARTAWSLPVHQWVRIAYNLRLSLSDQWVYKKRVVNVGLFEPGSSLKMFVEREPTHTYEDFAQLW